jgi:hypothetical protein
MNKNPCRRLTELYQQFLEFNRNEVDLTVMQEISALQELKQVSDLVSERWSLYKDYQREVRSLLRQWFDNDEFIDSLVFEPDGRVRVAGDLFLGDSGIDTFPSLIRSVDGMLFLSCTSLNSIDYLEEAGSVNVAGCFSLQSMKRLKIVKRILRINDTPLQSLPSLEEVGTLKAFIHSSLKQADKLKIVYHKLDIRGTELESLPALKKVGTLQATGLKSLQRLDSLELAASNLLLGGTSISSLSSLKNVSGRMDLSGVKAKTEIPNLNSIGGSLNLSSADVQGFPSLISIGEALNLCDSSMISFDDFFPNLEEIGMDIDNHSIYASNSSEYVSIFLIINRRKISLAGNIYIEEENE